MVNKNNVGVSEPTKTVTYEFADGTKSIIEVPVKFAEMIEVSRREEESSERKDRYWCKVRLDLADYEGDWFVDKSPTPVEALILKEEEKERQELIEEEKKVEVEFMKSLTETQRRRLNMRLEDPNITLREIARIDGVNIRAVVECFEAIGKKFKKYFPNN